MIMYFFKVIKQVIFNHKENIKKKLLAMYFFNIFNNKSDKKNNDLKKINNKIDTQVFVNNYLKNDKLNYILLKIVLKKDKNINTSKCLNIINNDINIEKYNYNYLKYLKNYLSYPDVSLDYFNINYKHNFKNYLYFLYKQDKILIKKYKRAKVFRRIMTNNHYYLQAKRNKNSWYHDKVFLFYFNYVNSMKKKRRERKLSFIKRILKKSKEKFSFQYRPKNNYFKKLRKFNRKKIIELTKGYDLNFKKNLFTKKAYKKNNLLKNLRNNIYFKEDLRKRIKYNFNIKDKTDLKFIKYRGIVLINKNKKKNLFLIDFNKLLTKDTNNLYAVKIFKKNRFLEGITKFYNTRACYKRKNFYKNKSYYQKYWENNNNVKSKVLLYKENLLKTEYYYLDPGFLFIRFNLRDINFNYQYLDAFITTIESKGFFVIVYIFFYIPIFVFISLIKNILKK